MITTEEFDKKFENGEDMAPYLELDKGRHVNLDAKRVNVDFPQWMVTSLDQEAQRIGVTRQSVIKMWIADRLQELQNVAL